MALTGDFSALADFYSRLKKMPQASREIAKAVAPVAEKLVGESFASQSSPTGQAWPATKSGAPAFGGGDAGGRVLARLAGKSTVRVTILYPLHFHQDGTRRVGKKRMAAIRRGILGAAGRSAAVAIKVPRKQKGESEFAYQQRLAATIARKNARAEAVKGAKMGADFAAEQARSASGYHDPPRPMIPDEGDPIPSAWIPPIREAAAGVMAKYGATEARS